MATGRLMTILRVFAEKNEDKTIFCFSFQRASWKKRAMRRPWFVLVRET
jgi:hypothetical protein